MDLTETSSNKTNRLLNDKKSSKLVGEERQGRDSNPRVQKVHWLSGAAIHCSYDSRPAPYYREMDNH
ncbi:MAG: hypothetical protein ACFFDI_23105 [Promethearchaeota archaeon]